MRLLQLTHAVTRRATPAALSLALLPLASAYLSCSPSAASGPTPSATPSPVAATAAQETAHAAEVGELPARERGAAAFEPFIGMSGDRRFETRTVEKKLTRTKFEVSANYPQLLGDTGPQARRFNRLVRALVFEEIGPYLEDQPDHEKEKSDFWKDVKEWHRVSHKIIFASDDLISVFFYVEGYPWGAAHGYHSPRTFNYDLKRGRALSLADLFKPNSGHLKVIARLCADDLRRQKVQSLIMDDGVRPLSKNFKAWVLTPKGIVLIFEEYQVAAYADGEPKVLIPYERLRDIIDPRGALASLAADAPINPRPRKPEST